MENWKIILASASPRRRELLGQIGLDFQALISEVEEKVTTDVPCLVVEQLSARKAEAVAEKLQVEGSRARNLHEEGSHVAKLHEESGHTAKLDEEDRHVVKLHEESGYTAKLDEEDSYAAKLHTDRFCEEGTGMEDSVMGGDGSGMESVVVIGADTIVACDGQILGKPHDKKEAVLMLKKLQGRSHQVYTGVTLICQGKARTFHEVTEVEFYPMTDREISEYVATLDPLDKAGAYGIQGFCARYIKGIVGDYNNVVGLPVGRLYQELKRLWAEL